MPARWYELLRERMQVEKERMRAIKDGSIVEYDRLEEFLIVAESLDRQMLQVMRQAIAEVLACEEVSIMQPVGATRGPGSSSSSAGGALPVTKITADSLDYCFAVIAPSSPAVRHVVAPITRAAD